MAARKEASGAALFNLRSTSGLPVVVDINLRSPWWNIEKASELMQNASCVKLNDAELEAVGGAGRDLKATARDFKTELCIGSLVVTLGEEGAFALADDSFCEVQAPPVENLVDAVGAGDAFSAVVILGLLGGWPWPDTLRRAANFAAEVCSYRGAIREDRRLYQRATRQWRDE